ncbi:ABC transporter ATP-binding protein [Neisseria sp. Ec49-e6-T10]|uniref:ABC transporter ATP-binding protein n=1 Tax=Neisseria sp. Ec49-e6-T10 TaxID=3140744 RepID=UPI003EBAAE03
MSGFAISIEHVSKIYPNGFQALDNISFNVKEGEFFALLGPNGAGKTTLISAMSGLGKQSSGTIKIMGFDTQKDAYQARMNLGVVPQELVFDPFFTVKEALRFQSGYFGIKNNEAWLDEILEKLGLADKAKTNMRALSGGMKRRVMVAQSLVHRPPVIILDEPTAGVDVELRQNLWSFIQELNQQGGHTIVLTTHYLEEAQALCNRIAMLKRGKLIALDEKEHLLNNETGHLLWIQIDQVLPEPLRPLFLRQQDSGLVLQLTQLEQVADVVTLLQQSHIKLNKMQILQNDLEEVFLRLTHDDEKNQRT